MTTDLQSRIAAIKAECEEILTLSEKATPRPWIVLPSCNWGHTFSFIDAGNFAASDASMPTENARFIAHARNVSPAMARVVLLTTHDAEMKEDEHLLQLIANQWEGK